MSDDRSTTVQDELELATAFEAERPRLRAVATRMLGTTGDADDAVQEAWLRLSRTDSAGIDNLAGWLTTVVGRICLDQLRSRTTRREDPLDERPEPATGDGPSEHAELADSMGTALLVVLDTLTPQERLAVVLHDMFGVPFPELADLLEVSPAAARQYASRGRRRLRGADTPHRDPGRQQRIVTAFLAASKAGEFDELVRLLAPDVVLRSDAAAAAMGSTAEVRGAQDVASFLSGRARAARVVLVDGVAQGVWSLRGEVKVAFLFTTEGERVTDIELVADPARLAAMWVTPA